MRVHPVTFFAQSNSRPLRMSMLLIALLVGGCGEKPAVTPDAVRAVKVEAVRAEQGATVRFTGVLRQRESASLAFESAGVLARLQVDVGDAFEKGQVLAVLDRQPALLRLQQAQANASGAAAQTEERALNYQRQKTLFAAGSAAQSVVEAARASYEQSVAKRARAKADLALAQREAERSQLLAPFAGRVVARRAAQHAVLTPGQAVLEVESRADRQVVAAVPTAQAVGLRPGDRARGWATSGPVAGVDLILEGVSPRAEDGLTRTCLFRVIDASDAFASGVTLQVQMAPDAAAQPLSVPVRALSMDAGTGAATSADTARVFVYQPGGTVTVRSVSLGPVREGRAVVTQGLAEGEQVVTAGVAYLQDGQAVSLFQPTTRLTEATP